MAGKSQYARDAEATRARSGGASGVAADESDEQHKNTLAGERKEFTAAVAKAGAGAFVPPKQNAGESAGAYAARVREAREASNQKRAMSTLK